MDAGNALFPQQLATATEGRVIVDAMGAMGYDAMAVGAMDAVRGLDVLLARRDEAAFPFLSANLVDATRGEPLFAPHATVERGELAIGLIGLTEGSILQWPGVAERAQALDPVEAARRYVGELRDRVGVLVVLSNLGLERDEELARTVPGIDVIVGARSAQLMQEPLAIGGTLIVQQGYRGEWLGRLQVRYDDAGEVAEATAGFVALTEHYADDSEVAALVDAYRAEVSGPVGESTAPIVPPAP